jgi:hypothetical protein
MTAQLISSLTELEGIGTVALRHLHLPSPHSNSAALGTLPPLYHPPPAISQRWPSSTFGNPDDPYIAGPMSTSTTYDPAYAVSTPSFHTPTLSSPLHQAFNPIAPGFPFQYQEPSLSNVRQPMPSVGQLSARVPSPGQQTTAYQGTATGLSQSMPAPPPADYGWTASNEWEPPMAPTPQNSATRRGASHKRRPSRQKGPYDR